MKHEITHPPINRTRLIRAPEVLRLTGIGHRSTLYRYVRDKTFPAPKCLSKRSRAWRMGDVQDWMAALPDASPETEGSAS